MLVNPEIVQEWVDGVRDEADDPEAAHVREDVLRENVLEAIAEGTIVDAQTCARLALSTDEFLHIRWYA